MNSRLISSSVFVFCTFASAQLFAALPDLWVLTLDAQHSWLDLELNAATFVIGDQTDAPQRLDQGPAGSHDGPALLGWLRAVIPCPVRSSSR